MANVRYFVLALGGSATAADNLAALLPPATERPANLDQLLARLCADSQPAVVAVTFADEGGTAATVARLLAELRLELPPYRLLLCDARNDAWALTAEATALAPLRLSPPGTTALAFERAMAAAVQELQRAGGQAAAARPAQPPLDRQRRRSLLGVLAALERLKVEGLPAAGAS